MKLTHELKIFFNLLFFINVNTALRKQEIENLKLWEKFYAAENKFP